MIGCRCDKGAFRSGSEKAAAAEDAVSLGHQRGDPSGVEIGGDRPVGAGDAIVDEGADSVVPIAIVRGVDRVFVLVVRDQDVAGDLEIAADRMVVDEDVSSL